MPKKSPKSTRVKSAKKQNIAKRYYENLKLRARDLKSRRPHRSFRMTKRRDYIRSLKLPGYFAFTHYVNKTLLQNKRIFITLILTYGIAAALVGGVINQDSYQQTQDLLESTSGELFNGDFGEFAKSGTLLLGVIGESFNANYLQIEQQLYLSIFAILAWLTSVWLLRMVISGKKPKFRDGLYNAGAPLVASTLIFLVLLLQLVPVGVLALAYGVLSAQNLLSTGFALMIFHLLGATVISMVLYWITTTFIALIVVTLPGVYPMQAMKVAGDIVIGRRLRILLRLIWMMCTVVLSWVIIVLPMIMLDSWLKNTFSVLQNIPIVPVIISLMSAASVVWISSYVYLLYRKVVDDDAKPA